MGNAMGNMMASPEASLPRMALIVTLAAALARQRRSLKSVAPALSSSAWILTLASLLASALRHDKPKALSAPVPKAQSRARLQAHETPEVPCAEEPCVEEPWFEPPMRRDSAQLGRVSQRARASTSSGLHMTHVEGRKSAAKRGLIEPEDKDVAALEFVFSWLGYAPHHLSPCVKALHQHFPGSLPGSVMLERIKHATKPLGMNRENTLYGQSICPDEINNEKGDLPYLLKNYWGEVFPLGGIGGPPFVGKTGFKAFSHHVPDGGNIFMMFGPHMAVSDAGEVGKYLRRGQKHHSTACGALCAAYNSCCEGKTGPSYHNPMDLQQNWLRDSLAKAVPEIQQAPNPMAALAIHSYEMVERKIQAIVDNEFGSGYLVLLGGVQINMPEPYEDHFMPLFFEAVKMGSEPIDLLSSFDLNKYAEEIFQGKEQHHASLVCNEIGVNHIERRKDASKSGPTSTDKDDVTATEFVFSWLGMAPNPSSPCVRTLHTQFPGALPGSVISARMKKATKPLGMRSANTLYGQSICPDEINNEKGTLADLLEEYWGEVFPLGGIGGPPFVGQTGFKAFSHHVPDGGNIFMLFGPHIGISDAGEVGKYLRRGQKHHSTACGALCAAYNSCCEGKFGPEYHNPVDLQQNWLRDSLAPAVPQIQKASNPMAALAVHSYEMVEKKIMAIVDNEFGPGYLVLLGGVQINMPEPYEDHFMPLFFQAHKAGAEPIDLISFFDIDIYAQEMVGQQD